MPSANSHLRLFTQEKGYNKNPSKLKKMHYVYYITQTILHSPSIMNHPLWG